MCLEVFVGNNHCNIPCSRYIHVNFYLQSDVINYQQVGHSEFEVIHFLRNKWKYELTMYFKHEMIGKHFTETSNKVELQINRVQINCVF